MLPLKSVQTTKIGEYVSSRDFGCQTEGGNCFRFEDRAALPFIAAPMRRLNVAFRNSASDNILRSTHYQSLHQSH